MLENYRSMLRKFGWDNHSTDPFDFGWDDPMLNANMPDKALEIPLLEDKVLEVPTPRSQSAREADIDIMVVKALEYDTQWKYRSANAVEIVLRDNLGVTATHQEVHDSIQRLLASGAIVASSVNPCVWGSVARIKLLEQKVVTPLVSSVQFVACPSPEPKMCESAQDGFAYADKNMRNSSNNLDDYPSNREKALMMIDQLPERLIVKALSDALVHAREVGQREHIKADRIERVNQFVVSLRRHFGYMGDHYKTEREFLSSQLSRKEVWFDAGVLNPSELTELTASLKHRDVSNWLAQAEAMAPSYGDLKAEIEKDLQRLKGSILVAESCNKTTGELNKNADKVLVEMAALAADM